MYVLFCAFDKNRAPIGANLKKTKKKKPKELRIAFSLAYNNQTHFYLSFSSLLVSIHKWRHTEGEGDVRCFVTTGYKA